MVVVHCYDSLLMIESCVWVERQLFKRVGVLIYICTRVRVDCMRSNVIINIDPGYSLHLLPLLPRKRISRKASEIITFNRAVIPPEVLAEMHTRVRNGRNPAQDNNNIHRSNHNHHQIIIKSSSIIIIIILQVCCTKK